MISQKYDYITIMHSTPGQHSTIFSEMTNRKYMIIFKKWRLRIVSQTNNNE